MIDFKINIQADEARTTTDWPIKPADVVEAYRKTGLTPVRQEWVDFRLGCACPLGVLAVVAPKPCNFEHRNAVDRFSNSDVEIALSGVACNPEGYAVDDPDHRISDTACFVSAFARAFDKSSVAELREECDELIALVGKLVVPWDGWEILAWRNALAVQEALHAADLDPADLEITDYD